jgi:hypothetical protein
MKPVPKITATMKTEPATMPTHAATWFNRLGLCGGGDTTAAGGGGGGTVSVCTGTGPVGAVEGSGESLMSAMMRALS